jgi:MFS family permease
MSARLLVLCAGFAGLLFDGFELGLMPLASLSVSKDLLGSAYTPTLGGDWFARFTAALMLGAACGGILLGSLGDRIGRARAMGISTPRYFLLPTSSRVRGRRSHPLRRRLTTAALSSWRHPTPRRSRR